MLRRQGGGVRRQDASLQSLAVTGVWQGRPVYFHSFTSIPLSIRTLPPACTALSADLLQARVAVVKVNRLAVSVVAAVVLVFPPPVVPQVEDMPPGRGEDITSYYWNLLYKFTWSQKVPPWGHIVHILWCVFGLVPYFLDWDKLPISTLLEWHDQQSAIGLILGVQILSAIYFIKLRHLCD